MRKSDGVTPALQHGAVAPHKLRRARAGAARNHESAASPVYMREILRSRSSDVVGSDVSCIQQRIFTTPPAAIASCCTASQVARMGSQLKKIPCTRAVSRVPYRAVRDPA